MTSLSSALSWRRRMLVIRSVAVSLLAMFYLLSSYPGADHSLRVIALLTLACVPNLNVWLQGAATERWQSRWLRLELAADVLLFLPLLHALGGADNPVAFYLLVPLLVAALSTPWLHTLALWLVSSVGWGLLLQWRLAPMPGSHHDHLAAGVHPVHSLGMWLIFCLLGLVLVVLGQHIQRQNQAVRRREAVALELGLQRERMYQLAARQANLAHEISTPLNSLLWLLDDLEGSDDPAQRADLLERLRQCAQRLNTVVRESGEETAQTPASQPLSQYVAQASERSRLLVPALDVTFSGPEDPLLAGTDCWQRVFLNLFYNACDAGATRIDVRCVHMDGELLMQVADNGPTSEAAATRPGGMGVGLALVETALATREAELELIHGRDWTVARIRIPDRPHEHSDPQA
ncbi:MAG: HAMP domain-containing sensor histidine kinase [Alcanivoracaceae bacterium]|nr:HAMP domain-containing sensor histidine kinase [Alcanivoracaceae bacterium]